MISEILKISTVLLRDFISSITKRKRSGGWIYTSNLFLFLVNERARNYVSLLPVRKRTPWKQLYPTASDLSLNMLDFLLTFNPNRRVSVEEALKHPYLAQYYDPSDEPTAPHPFTFDMELDDLPLPQLKQLIYEETESIHERLQQRE